MILGTAQFGFSYAGSPAQYTRDELDEILAFASKIGFSALDTATDYADSEERLGKCDLTNFAINTKLPANLDFNKNKLKDHLSQSLDRLCVSSLNILFIHDCRAIEDNRQIGILNDFFSEALSEGSIAKVGISIYDPRQVEQLIGNLKFEVIQAPFNFFDDRILKFRSSNPSLNFEYQYRSIFLQGLLVDQNRKERSLFNDQFFKFDDCVSNSDCINGLDYCLNYSKTHIGLENTIIGANCINDLKEIHFMLTHDKTHNLPLNEFSKINEVLVNPYLWPR